MARTTFDLIDGLPFGKGADEELLKDVTLRELSGGDLIDARVESERVVETKDGPRLVGSPELLALHCLRRQVVNVGKIKGPLSMADLRRLTLADLRELEQRADDMDVAVLAAKLGARGRADGAPGAD